MKAIEYGKKFYLEEGEQYILPGHLKLQCCDCGLVHKFEFYLLDKKQEDTVYYRVYRDNRATAQARRRMKENGITLICNGYK